MGVRRDVAATVGSRLWVAAMSFAFVPFYIRLLGVEAYGLIGLFASMMAVFAVLDLGLSVTVNRELARLGPGPGARPEARTLLRTLEAVYWATAAAIGAGLALAAPWIARRWLTLDALDPDAATDAIRLMGLVATLRWPVALYTGALMGAGRQVRLAGVAAAAATLQGGGAVLALLAAPTIAVFFSWQAAVAAAQVALLAWLSWRELPLAGHRATFSAPTLRAVGGFAAGVAGITILSVVLTQLDKLILSRMLPLAEFGYYSLAGALAATVGIAGGAAYASLFPTLSALAAGGRGDELRRTYHGGSQAMALLVAPAALTVAFFSPELLRSYLRDPVLAAETADLLRLLVVGHGLLTLMLLPLALQLAHGWTGLSLWKNVVAVALFVPALWFMVRRFGPEGAATTWIALTAGYFLVEVQVMHRRLLRGEQWRWYFADIAPTVAISGAVLAVARAVVGPATPELAALAVIGAAGLLSLALSTLATPAGRERLMRALAARRSARVGPAGA